MTEVVPTVIIGGGQAGLAMGYHLKLAGEPFVIIDAGQRVGDSWRARWDSLRLFSLPRYASLPGWPITTDSFPTRDEMADYLEAYAEHFDLPVRTDTRVERLTRTDEGFLLETSAGPLRAGRVIVASGAYQTPRIPAFADELDPAITQLHSSRYRNAGQLLDGPVLIVGAANSGADIALESAAAGHPTWMAGRHPGQVPFRIETRRAKVLVPIVMFVFRRVLTVNTPIGRKAQAALHGHGIEPGPGQAGRSGRGRRAPGRTDRGVRDGRPVTADGEVLEPRTVVWCTGFRPDYGWIELPVTNADGEIRHERGVSAEPDLYFIGLEFQFSAASPTIQGLDQDARYLMRAIRRAGTPAIKAPATRRRHQPASRLTDPGRPGRVGRPQAGEIIPLTGGPGGEHARHQGRVVQPAVEDGVDQIIERGPHGVHVRLLAAADEPVRRIDVGQVPSQEDPQRLADDAGRGEQIDQQVPGAGRQADLLGELSLRREQRILAVDIEQARRAARSAGAGPGAGTAAPARPDHDHRER